MDLPLGFGVGQAGRSEHLVFPVLTCGDPAKGRDHVVGGISQADPRSELKRPGLLCPLEYVSAPWELLFLGKVKTISEKGCEEGS